MQTEEKTPLCGRTRPTPAGPGLAEQTKQDAPGSQRGFFCKGCAATSGVVLPAALSCINLERACVWELHHLEPNNSLLSGGTVHTRGEGLLQLTQDAP